MKLLKDILYGTRIQETTGSTHVAIEDVTFDSRKTKAFSLFIAVRGTQFDGHNYIEEAIEKGAIAVVAEELPEEKKEGVTYIRVQDPGASVGPIAAAFYDYPSEHMKVIAVTGTNGKTTTVSLLHQLFAPWAVNLECSALSKIES